MPLWGNKDQANNAPKYKILSTSPNTGIDLFGTQIVGLDDGEIQTGHKADHAGWVRVQRGTGPVASITITAGGSGYSNADTVKVSGGTTNAAATLTTNSTGGIATVTLTNGGAGFTNTSGSTLAITTANGTGANLAFTLGGRANRVQTEVLVTQTAMSANNSTL
jgi:hypothetical protein